MRDFCPEENTAYTVTDETDPASGHDCRLRSGSSVTILKGGRLDISETRERETNSLGPAGAAILVTAPAKGIVNRGLVKGTRYGIYLGNPAWVQGASGAPGDIINEGTIESTQADSYAIFVNGALESDATRTLINRGKISGAVALGGWKLNIEGQEASIAGAVSGAGDVNLKSDAVFTTGGAFSASAFRIESGAHLNLGHAITADMTNQGTVQIAPSRTGSVTGAYRQSGTLILGAANASSFSGLQVSGDATFESGSVLFLTGASDTRFSNNDALADVVALTPPESGSSRTLVNNGLTVSDDIPFLHFEIDSSRPSDSTSIDLLAKTDDECSGVVWRVYDRECTLGASKSLTVKEDGGFRSTGDGEHGVAVSESATATVIRNEGSITGAVDGIHVPVTSGVSEGIHNEAGGVIRAGSGKAINIVRSSDANGRATPATIINHGTIEGVIELDNWTLESHDSEENNPRPLQVTGAGGSRVVLYGAVHPESRFNVGGVTIKPGAEVRLNVRSGEGGPVHDDFTVTGGTLTIEDGAHIVLNFPDAYAGAPSYSGASLTSVVSAPDGLNADTGEIEISDNLLNRVFSARKNGNAIDVSSGKGCEGVISETYTGEECVMLQGNSLDLAYGGSITASQPGQNAVRVAAAGSAGIVNSGTLSGAQHGVFLERDAGLIGAIENIARYYEERHSGRVIRRFVQEIRGGTDGIHVASSADIARGITNRGGWFSNEQGSGCAESGGFFTLVTEAHIVGEDDGIHVADGGDISGGITNANQEGSGYRHAPVGTPCYLSEVLSFIKGGNRGIFVESGGDISGGIVNKARIEGGNYAVKLDNDIPEGESRTFTNYGTIEGAVSLGEWTLNIEGNHPSIRGAVTGSGTVNVNGAFTTDDTFDVGAAYVRSGSTLTLRHGFTVQDRFVNHGNLELESHQTIKGDYTQENGGTLTIHVSPAHATLTIDGAATFRTNPKFALEFSADARYLGTPLHDVVRVTGKGNRLSFGNAGDAVITDNRLLWNFVARKSGNTIDVYAIPVACEGQIFLPENASCVLGEGNGLTIYDDGGFDTRESSESAVRVDGANAKGILHSGTIDGGVHGLVVRNGGDLPGGFKGRRRKDASGSGLVRGKVDGIRVAAESDISGGVVNAADGVIRGGEDGISVGTQSDISGGIVNAERGLIRGGEDGISVDATSDISGGIVNRGTIQGDGDNDGAGKAVNILRSTGESRTLTNYGAIVGAVALGNWELALEEGADVSGEVTGEGARVNVNADFTSRARFNVNRFHVASGAIFTMKENVATRAGFTNEGTLFVPGDRAVQISGGYRQEADGKLRIGISGEAENFHGRLTIDGNAVFPKDGVLEIRVSPNALLTDGMRLPVVLVTNGTLRIDGLALTDDSARWQFTYTAEGNGIDLIASKASSFTDDDDPPPPPPPGKPEDKDPEDNEPEGNDPEGNEPEGNEPEGNDPSPGTIPQGMPLGDVNRVLQSVTEAQGDMQTVLGALKPLETDKEAYGKAVGQLVPGGSHFEHRTSILLTSSQVARLLQEQIARGDGGMEETRTAFASAGEHAAIRGEGNAFSSLDAFLTPEAQKAEPLWVRPFYQRAEYDDGEGLFGFDLNAQGVVAGVNGTLNDQWKLGIGGAWSQAGVEGEDGGLHRTDLAYYELVGVAHHWPENREGFLDILASVGRADLETARQIRIGDTIARTARSEHSAWFGQFKLESGAYFQPASGLVLSPFASLNILYASEEAYEETGAGAISLKVKKQDTAAALVGAGGRAGWHPAQAFPIWLKAHLRVAYDTLAEEQEIQAAFRGGGDWFSVTGKDISPLSLSGGAGIEILTANNLSVSLNYDFEARSGYLSHTASALVKVPF